MLTVPDMNAILHASRRGLALMADKTGPREMAAHWLALEKCQHHFQQLAEKMEKEAAEEKAADGSKNGKQA